jgi:protein tyrosine/serine phosphatase
MPFHRLISCLIGLAACLTPACTSYQRGVSAAHGIANFDQVNAHLWRGAQPDERGLETLKTLGVATIINLRMADDVLPFEKSLARLPRRSPAEADRPGLLYINVPLPGFSAPTAADVARILALIETSPPPVFIHCEHGADRTGTIIACYRIRHDHWTAEQALAEAKFYGLSNWEFGMKRFVRSYQP